MIITNAMNYHKNSVKLLIYGPPGTGKTPLALTAEAPIIIASDPGLETIKGYDIAIAEVTNYKEVIDSFKWITESNETRFYNTICLDSVSQHADFIAYHHISKARDKRQGYGLYQEEYMTYMNKIVFDIDKNFYLIARREDVLIDKKNDIYEFWPSVNTAKMRTWTTHQFDQILAIKKENESTQYERIVIQTKGDHLYKARDRSGALDPIEEPNIYNIINKIKNGVK